MCIVFMVYTLLLARVLQELFVPLCMSTRIQLAIDLGKKLGEALLLATQQHTMAAKMSAAKVEWFIGKGFVT